MGHFSDALDFFMLALAMLGIGRYSAKGNQPAAVAYACIVVLLVRILILKVAA